MIDPIRSEQRLIFILAALIFGPIFMLGPATGGICMLIFAPFSITNVLVATGLVLGSGFIAYHMTQNYQWVEFDGNRIRGRRFWSRRLVENTLPDVVEIRPLGALARNTVTGITDTLMGPVRGYEICFHHGPSIAVMRHDMKNAEQLAVAVEQALGARGA